MPAPTQLARLTELWHPKSPSINRATPPFTEHLGTYRGSKRIDWTATVCEACRDECMRNGGNWGDFNLPGYGWVDCGYF
jgi:hypothetical protein